MRRHTTPNTTPLSSWADEDKEKGKEKEKEARIEAPPMRTSEAGEHDGEVAQPDPPAVSEELPTPLGAERLDIDQDDRELHLRRVFVVGGSGEWAYRTSRQWHVVADSLYSPLACHFAGRFLVAVPADASLVPHERWLVVRGWHPPPPERKLYIEDEDAGLPRMEHRD